MKKKRISFGTFKMSNFFTVATIAGLSPYRKILSLLCRRAILTALLIIPATSFGFALIDQSTLIKGSLASVEQVKDIYPIVEQELNSKNSDSESILLINKALESRGLPLIDMESPDFDIKVIGVNGFTGTTSIGVRIVDGKHRFCFPCSNGWNSFEFGILKWEKSARNPNGKYYQIINDTQKKQGYGVNGTVNSWNWPAKRWAMFTVNTEEIQGVLLLFDDSAEVFLLTLPKKGDISPPQYIVQTLDKTRISFQVRGTSIEELQYEPKNISITKSSYINETKVRMLLKELNITNPK